MNYTKQIIKVAKFITNKYAEPVASANPATKLNPNLEELKDYLNSTVPNVIDILQTTGGNFKRTFDSEQRKTTGRVPYFNILDELYRYPFRTSISLNGMLSSMNSTPNQNTIVGLLNTVKYHSDPNKKDSLASVVNYWNNSLNISNIPLYKQNQASLNTSVQILKEISSDGSKILSPPRKTYKEEIEELKKQWKKDLQPQKPTTTPSENISMTPTGPQQAKSTTVTESPWDLSEEQKKRMEQMRQYW